MSNVFTIALNALVPVYLIIFFGYLCKRIGWVREDQQPFMSKIGSRIFLPIMLFYNIYTSDLSSATDSRLFIFCAVSLIAGYLLIFSLDAFFVKDSYRKSAMIQACFRGNYALVVLALIAGLQSEILCPASLIGVIIVPFQNVFAIIALETYGGGKVNPLKILVSILKNPQNIG